MRKTPVAGIHNRKGDVQIMRTALWWSLALVLCLGLASAYAQDENKSEEPAKAQQPNTFHAYRVGFAINELEDGKKINARHYSMDLNTGDRQQLKIGTRVPVVSAGSLASNNSLAQYQYLDVGTNILCKLVEQRGGDVSLDVQSDFSNFSNSQESKATSQPLARAPIIRQITINGSTLTALAETVVIGTVDDPNSNREFQLEATVTKLR
jgi:hypothetical protein